MTALRVQIPGNCFCIDGVYSAEECQQTIAWAEAQGFDAAPVTTGMGFVHLPSVRNNTRVMVDDPERMAELWERVAEHIPETLGPWRAHGLNERIRVYRYMPGQYFRSHYDGCFRRNRHEESFFTLMVYLNDDFEGGGTGFSRSETVEPVRGSSLVFLHRLKHQGHTVTSGVKYVLRTDVMYRR